MEEVGAEEERGLWKKVEPHHEKGEYEEEEVDEEKHKKVEEKEGEYQEGEDHRQQ